VYLKILGDVQQISPVAIEADLGVKAWGSVGCLDVEVAQYVMKTPWASG
jgi:hypothetical protein